ncbi:MAG: hypothetical protein HQ506_09100 [Candidatus Marinimicrobia bacterium]|nr:hypothetical protein [Candidatus Neomarinimicrobiota bacterium]
MGINLRRAYSNPLSQAELLRKFVNSQKAEDQPFTIQIANHLISMNVKQEEQHWWSPELTLRLEGEGSETTFYESIGPNSSMFTLAMFFVILGAVVFLAALMMSLSQMTIGDSPVLALVVTLFSGLLIVITFGVLALGRLKAADQVSRLRGFAQHLIEN